MPNLEMLPSWAGRIAEPTGPPSPPAAFALAPEDELVELSSEGIYHRPTTPVTSDDDDEPPIQEWVVHRPDAVPPVTAAPAAAALAPARDRALDPARDRGAPTGPGRVRRLARVLAILVLALIVLGAGVAAGYLFTSMT